MSNLLWDEILGIYIRIVSDFKSVGKGVGHSERKYFDQLGLSLSISLICEKNEHKWINK